MNDEITVYCERCKGKYPSKIDKRNGYLKCTFCNDFTGAIRNFKRNTKANTEGK